MTDNTPQPNEQHWMLLVLFLKEICDQRGISQADLAEMTGMKQPSISRLFSLQYCPNMRTFMAVVHALQLNVFFETRDAKDDLTLGFERAMTALGRRPDNLPKN